MNSSGTTVYSFDTYDESGNPLTQTNFVYKDVAYHHADFFWDGRQLSSIKVWNDTGETTLVAQLDYLYNDQGYRIKKTITQGNNVDTWSYNLAESTVLRETHVRKVGGTTTETHETFFLYDADGTLTGYVRDGEPYYYLKDLQGNILAVIEEDGTELIEYEYDPYGNILSLTSWDDFLANPYTYRGYRYDSEIGMYYLNSRYYSPVLSRFLNSDGMLGQQGDVLSTNMYAYCENNPIMNLDPTGYWVLSLLGFTLYLGTNFLSVWWVFDGKGNQGLLITGGISLTYPQAGISYSPFFSWRKTIFDLEGISFSAGFSGTYKGISVGADLLGDSKGPLGIQLNIGLSTASINAQISFCTTTLIEFRKVPNIAQISQMIVAIKMAFLKFK